MNSPPTQKGHRRWALFMVPHAEHLFKEVTSFKPLPAKKRDRFLLCEVFFFGTARRIDSQRPPSREGIRGILMPNAAGIIKGKRVAMSASIGYRDRLVARERSRGAEYSGASGNRDERIQAAAIVQSKTGPKLPPLQ